MTTALEEQPTTSAFANPARRLRIQTAAVRVSLSCFGTRKTLSAEQKNQVADTFGAEGDFLSAGKKLLDTRHPAFKAVTAIKNRITSLWKGMSLPFPESGIRLIRQDKIDEFNRHMTELQEELQEAVWRLDEHFAELKSAASQRLGSLYNPADYPESLQGLFTVSWDFPSVEPPPYLQQLHPEVYQQECQRVAARFNEAIQLAEQAFMEELSNLVDHLTDRLSGQEDGKPKVFRDSAVANLTAFFERFRQLNVNSNDQLDQLVVDCQQVVGGVAPQQLRDDQSLRQQVSTELSRVQSVLDGLLVDRPRRNILRRPK